MSVIDVRAQQIVIDALRLDPKNIQKIILCHTPSKLSAEPGMYLSTQDRLQELFACNCDATIAVFPNANFVRRLCKQFQRDRFSVEFVFACHASSDPNDLVLDLLSKFSVDFRFIQEVSYLVELPEKNFRPNFNLHWYCHSASSCEALIPKVIAEIPDIQELLKDDHGPLTCKSIKKNGCCEILNSGNSFHPVLITLPQSRPSMSSSPNVEILLLIILPVQVKPGVK